MGSSWSSPAADALTVLWVPPQSESTKPLNCQSCLSTSVSSVFVLASVIAVDGVIGAHDCSRVADADADMEGEQIGFLHCPLADDHVHFVAAIFLIVHRRSA